MIIGLVEVRGQFYLENDLSAKFGDIWMACELSARNFMKEIELGVQIFLP